MGSDEYIDPTDQERAEHGQAMLCAAFDAMAQEVGADIEQEPPVMVAAILRAFAAAQRAGAEQCDRIEQNHKGESGSLISPCVDIAHIVATALWCHEHDLNPHHDEIGPQSIGSQSILAYGAACILMRQQQQLMADCEAACEGNFYFDDEADAAMPALRSMADSKRE